MRTETAELLTPTPASPGLPLPEDLDLTLSSRRPARLTDATLSAVAALPVPVPADETDTVAPGDVPEVSIVVVTFNNLPFTKMCLAALLAAVSGPSFELIVVDNASTDDTPQ